MGLVRRQCPTRGVSSQCMHTHPCGGVDREGMIGEPAAVDKRGGARGGGTGEAGRWGLASARANCYGERV